MHAMDNIFIVIACRINLIWHLSKKRCRKCILYFLPNLIKYRKQRISTSTISEYSEKEISSSRDENGHKNLITGFIRNIFIL